MRPGLLVLLAAALAGGLGACSARMPSEGETEADIPPVTVAGEPVSCINTSRITHTFVRSDRVIDFRMGGDPDYRNTLPSRCLALGYDRRFTYHPIAGQLCAGHTIHVVQADGAPGAACALGEFVPVEDAGF